MMDRFKKQYAPLAFWAVGLLAVCWLEGVNADELELGLPLEDSNGPGVTTEPVVLATQSPIPLVNLTADNLNEDGSINCQSLHYNCYGCIQHGCYWCPTDGLCFDTPEFVDREPTKQALYPNRSHGCKTKEDFTQTTCTAPGNVFSDPVYSAQKWIFESIKVESVWKRGIFGNGVKVRINDLGIQIDHPDFLNRIDINASCPQYEPSFGNSHGMTVASLLGATGNNSKCGVGIAPSASMSSCVLGSMSSEEMLVYKLDQFDISSNSWAFEGCGPMTSSQLFCEGTDCLRRLQEPRACPFVHIPFPGYKINPCDHCNFTIGQSNWDLDPGCQANITTHCSLFPREETRACHEFSDLIMYDADPWSGGECFFNNIPDAGLKALEMGVTQGRNGKGVIYTFAAGNEFAYGDNTNFQGYGSNTRFTITVASIGKSGLVASTSTPGASVFIAAPGGDDKQSVTKVVSASTFGKCGDQGTGTSWATPVVSGVVALMLEVNPDLTWRDVRHILARTAQVRNDGTDPTFAVNGAGFVHSNRYGFGIVDAEHAVELSERWRNVGPERMLVESANETIVIPDYNNTINATNTPTRLSLTFDDVGDFVTETVYLYIRKNHSSQGHLRIDLTSPSGMISVMTPGSRNEDSQSEWMKFTSVRYWGEDPTGTWTISIIDTKAGYATTCVENTDYSFAFNDDHTITCARKYIRDLSGFCWWGALDPNGAYFTKCDEGDQEACDLVERFQTEKSAGKTGPEACCWCGGGRSPDTVPEELLGWKLEIYGHDRSTEEGFFSGVGNDVELGKWGTRGRVRVDRFQVNREIDFLPGFQRPSTIPPAKDESSPNPGVRRRKE